MRLVMCCVPSPRHERFWAEYFPPFFCCTCALWLIHPGCVCGHRTEAFRADFAFFVIMAFLGDDEEERERRSSPPIVSSDSCLLLPPSLFLSLLPFFPTSLLSNPYPFLPLISSLSVFSLPPSILLSRLSSSYTCHRVSTIPDRHTFSHSLYNTNTRRHPFLLLLLLPRLYLFTDIHTHPQYLPSSSCSFYSDLLGPSSHPTIAQLHRHFLFSNL